VTDARNGPELEAIETVCSSAISARCVWISSRASAVINQMAVLFTASLGS
jgi:glycine cleavage system regulatory protein